MDKETLALIFQVIVMLLSLFFFFLTLSESEKAGRHKRLRLAVTTLAAAGIIFKLGKDVAWTIILFAVILITQIKFKKNGSDRLDNKTLGGGS